MQYFLFSQFHVDQVFHENFHDFNSAYGLYKFCTVNKQFKFLFCSPGPVSFPDLFNVLPQRSLHLIEHA